MKFFTLPIPEGIDRNKISFALKINSYEVNDDSYGHKFAKCLCHMKGYTWYNIKNKILVNIFYEEDII